MSLRPTHEPECIASSRERVVATIIDGRPRDLGGVAVRRVLPAATRRMVGPFIFLDEMGPTVFPPEHGIDVPPHPHIGLATVTYLFEGEILHRDSVGSEQVIRPGDINWMTAGRGIVHSERTPQDRRSSGSRLHGLQLWVALPTNHEETEPSFLHTPASALPSRDEDGVHVRVLAGTAYGMTSPVPTLSPLFYVDAELSSGRSLPLPREHEECALYVVEGALQCGSEHAEHGRMLVFESGAEVTLQAQRATRFVLLGGAPVGKRYIDWNFVSSRRERLERAKDDWREGRFPKVPGDELEFVPLPG